MSDPAQARAQLERWVTDLSSTAEGWLGSTAGVTDDGTFIALARFESEEAAQRSSDRPEQGAWWEQMAACFTAEPEFRNSTDVDVDLAGDPDAAGFVQVMQGKVSDPERARELMNSDPTDWQEFRPDILGSVSCNHEDGEWTMAIYFTSEEEAREGEQKEMPPEMKEIMDQMDALSVGEVRYFDLKDPWLHSPA
ncbi:hypothetical protein DDE18_01765 [Nocardioides gansuensis]|uniref:ABM domain-containing protein n=1 Tax=Nocardioides gansuensis TaxID=2138300 RepID=A0A2T8FFA7_9ACTN|nr:hypothetical protein [Nocardioides gansuensis]PVG84375.1 hypothetical protein DDE18_01765 [Nocardioides gansuensis]